MNERISKNLIKQDEYFQANASGLSEKEIKEIINNTNTKEKS